MEFKVLIYIVIGIIWLFSKLLNAKGKEKDKGSVFPESWTKPFEDQMEKVPKQVTTPIKIKKVTSGDGASISNRVSAPPFVRQEQRTNTVASFQTENRNILSEVQIIDEMDEKEVNDFARQLNYEIRNGQFDWKRAVVINELMSHQHFR